MLHGIEQVCEPVLLFFLVLHMKSTKGQNLGAALSTIHTLFNLHYECTKSVQVNATLTNSHLDKYYFVQDSIEHFHKNSIKNLLI